MRTKWYAKAIYMLIAVVLASSLLPMTVTVQAKEPYPSYPTLDETILNIMQSINVVGVSAAFVKDDKIVWANGYGWANIAEEKPVTRDTIFRIASISKTFVSTPLMQLWEQGKFGLDDDIGDYLGFPVRHPYYPDTKITFRMLMTHTAAVPETSYSRAPGGTLLKELLVPGGKYYNPAWWRPWKPGTQFRYSNFGCGIAACLVEVISGECFADYCIDHIFKPLGMDASFHVGDLVNFGNLGVIYRTDGTGGFIPAHDYYVEQPTREEYPFYLPLGNCYKSLYGGIYGGPAGGVRVSAVDLAKFMIAHMDGGVYNGVRILNKATADLMHQWQWFGDEYDHFYKQKGLLFHIVDGIADRRGMGHAGSAYGLLSDMYFEPEGRTGIVFIVNGGYYSSRPSGFYDIEEEVMNAIYAYLAGPPKPVLRTMWFTVGGDTMVTTAGFSLRTIVMPAASELKDGCVFVPAQTLGDAFKLHFSVDATGNVLTMTSYHGETVVTAKVGEASIEVNGETVPIASPIYTVTTPLSYAGSGIMLPVQDIAKAFGALYFDICPRTLGLVLIIIPRDD